MHRIIRTSLLAAALVSSSAITATAQSAKPPFSGSWVLDVEKSTRAPIVPPALSMDIRMNGTQLEVHRVITTPNGESEASLKYNTDGTPSSNQVKQGPMQFEAKSIVTWNGPALAFDTHIQAGEQDIVQKETWTLSPDGSALTILRSLNANGQELSATMVLTRKS